MRRTRIKICGIRDTTTALAAAAAGADAIGLVFVGRSPRHVTIDQAQQIVETLPAMVEPIGLFANEQPSRVLQITERVGLRTVQLHGDEPPQQVARLGSLRVVKALGFEVQRASDLLEPWRRGGPYLAGLLWDAPAAENRSTTGGWGERLDWAELARFQREENMEDLAPVILAGGLTPQNVAEAIETVRPYAVDVSSGVESSRGVKDVGLITAFCHAVRQADGSVGGAGPEPGDS